MKYYQFETVRLLQLERLTGVHRNTWRRWFNGKPMQTDTVAQAAKALEIEPPRLLKWIERRIEQGTQNVR